MRVTKELAREICRESGIAWDEDACEPTLQGEPISGIDVGSAQKKFGVHDGQGKT